MTVVANDCVADLSVDLFSSPNVPVSTNTLISFTQTGSLANPHWNGFFPTLFPPPGDSIHILLLDQNKNGVVLHLSTDAPIHGAYHDATDPVS